MAAIARTAARVTRAMIPAEIDFNHSARILEAYLREFARYFAGARVLYLLNEKPGSLCRIARSTCRTIGHDHESIW